MERDLNPWYNTTNSQWEYTNNLIPPLIPSLNPQQNNNSALFPTHNNPYGYSPSINGSIPLTGFSPFQLYPNTLCYNLPPPLYNFPTVVNTPTHLISNQTNVNGTINGTIDGTIDGTESEMQEDSEEIDALLYSDSDEYNNYIDELEEEASTGCSPVIRSNLVTGEEVASTSVHPKKRRIGTDLDASVLDTASSAKCCNVKNNRKNDNDGLEFSDAESSCVGEERERMDEEEEEREREEMSEKTDCVDLKLKRKRIQETVGLLRHIIPGGKGKDAATILDEAISYLKSLKLKAKALGNH